MEKKQDISYYRFRWEESPLPEKKQIDLNLKILIVLDRWNDLKVIPGINLFFLINNTKSCYKRGNVFCCDFHDTGAIKETLGRIHRICSDINIIINFSRFYKENKEIIDVNGLRECLIFPYHFMHELKKHDSLNKLFIIIVSVNAQKCCQTDIISPQSIIPIGFFKAAFMEANFISKFLWIDFDKEVSFEFIIKLAIKEIPLVRRHLEVVYRSGKRYIKKFKPIQIEKLNRNSLSLNRQDVILVTGGLSGLGKEVCKYLLKTMPCRIAATGRTMIPRKEPGGGYKGYDRGIPDHMAEKIHEIEVLEKSGFFRYYCFDISNYERVLKGIKTIEREAGRITGVVHCAGINDLRKPYLFAPKGFEEFEKSLDSIVNVLLPKVVGLNLIRQQTSTRKIHFFISFSSIAALTPELGHALSDYSLANSYLDVQTEAEAMRESSYFVSVQWNLVKGAGIGRTSFINPSAGLIPFELSDFRTVLSTLFSFTFPPVFAALKTGESFNPFWYE